MESIIVGVVTFCVGLLIGLIVGYYKSRAAHIKELGDVKAEHVKEITVLRTELHDKKSNADCVNCDLRSVVSGITGELKEGSYTFKTIQKDIGAIRTSIALLQQANEKQI